MAAPDSKRARGLGLKRFAPMLWVVLAWFGGWVTSYGELRSTPRLWPWLMHFLSDFAFRALGGFPAAQAHARPVVDVIRVATSPTLLAYAGWATFLVPLGFLVRMMGRAWIRSGGRDPLDRMRAWVASHRALTAAILAILPAVFGYHLFRAIYYWREVSAGDVLPFAVVGALAQLSAARAALRALLQPTIDPTEESRIEISPDEIKFDAVAVTRESRAAVGGLAGLSLAMVVWIAALPLATLFRDPRLFAAILAYMGVATLAATYFRFASRIAVGIDGVLVKGTSRTRFFSYRDLDSVRVGSTDLELVRRGKVVLRLQLHGADAVRRDAVAERVRQNIERIGRGEGAVAAQVVSTSSKDDLARVASGGADYRGASLSREALWALIEGPTVDAGARRAAAEALVKTSDAGERARLRVAAELCADPGVRVALKELAEAPADEGEVPPRQRVVA